MEWIGIDRSGGERNATDRIGLEGNEWHLNEFMPSLNHRITNLNA